MFNNNECNNLIYRNNNNNIIIIATLASELYRTMSSVSFVFVFSVLCYNNRKSVCGTICNDLCDDEDINRKIAGFIHMGQDTFWSI